MLKWSEFIDGEIIYEAFLPESTAESGCWLLRASRHGHVLAERQIRLLWAPTFGPDSGDVQALESELEQLMSVMNLPASDQLEGAYTPGPIEIEPPDPLLHAGSYRILGEFRVVCQEFGITGQSRDYLSLPRACSIEDLYPVAVTNVRLQKMQRFIALKKLVEAYPGLNRALPELVDALLRGNEEAIERILRVNGVRVGS